MKKTLLTFILAMGLCFSFGACNFGGDGNSESVDSSNSQSSSEQQDVTCTITFKQSGEANIVKTVKQGEDLTDVPAPKAKTGYTVVWDTTDFTNITEDMEVSAVATANKYTVTYDANGGSVASTTQEVTYDAETTLSTPEREDYYFLGWTYENDAVVSGEKWAIAENVTLVASWQDQRPEFTVTFVDGNQSTAVTVKKGESVTETDVPAFVGKVGHTVAWDKTDYTNITADMTVTAVYTPITYTVTYSAEGFEVHNETIQLTYGEVCTGLATLTSGMQTFLGWTYNGNTYTADSIWNVAEENVVLTASWASKNQVIVSFVDTNDSTITKTVYEGQTLTDIPTPSAKTGYTVDVENWYTDQACTQVASFESLQESKTVYAKATANSYKVTYNTNGGNSVEDTTVTYDSAYTLVTPTHSLEYMEFVAWKNVDGNAVSMTGTWTTDSGMELTAEWKDTRATYTITFVQAGEETKTYTVKAGESFTEIPETVQKTGYTIAWDETAIAKLTNVSENIEIVAKVEAKTYEIILNANGGSVSQKTITVTYGQAYEIIVPMHSDDKDFNGWTYNGNVVALKGTWTLDVQEGELTLVAQWGERGWTDNY